MWDTEGPFTNFNPFLSSLPSSSTLHFLLNSSIASAVTSHPQLLNLSVSSLALSSLWRPVLHFHPLTSYFPPVPTAHNIHPLFRSETTVVFPVTQLPREMAETSSSGTLDILPIFPFISFLIVPPTENVLPLPTLLFFRYIFYIRAQMTPTHSFLW